MLLTVNKCPNCKTNMLPSIIEIEGEPTYLGIDFCPLCRILNLPKDFVKELYTKLPLSQGPLNECRCKEPEGVTGDPNLCIHCHLPIKSRKRMKNKECLFSVLCEKFEEVPFRRGVHTEGNCYYCKKPVNNLAGNPSEWGIPLCHKDEPGKVKAHHIGCVSERLAKYEELKKEEKDMEDDHRKIIELQEKVDSIGTAIYIELLSTHDKPTASQLAERLNRILVKMITGKSK